MNRFFISKWCRDIEKQAAALRPYQIKVSFWPYGVATLKPRTAAHPPRLTRWAIDRSERHTADRKRKSRYTMLKTTENALRGLLALDQTIPPALANDAIGMLKAAKPGEPETDKAIDGETAAAMLGVSRRSLTNYATRGLIRRIGGKANKTIARFSLKSVRDYLNGVTPTPEAA